MVSASSSVIKLIYQESHDTHQEFELSGGEIIIGRDPDADITLSTPIVSRRHARLIRKGKDYFIEDLGSRNGTFLNNCRLDHPFSLNSGDEIRLGQSITLIYEVLDPDENILPPGIAETQIDEGTLVPDIVGPPQIVITIAGDSPKIYKLEKSNNLCGACRRQRSGYPFTNRVALSRYHEDGRRQFPNKDPP